MNIKNIRKEAIDFIRRNVNYVNQQMTLLERRDETSSSRTYQFVQDRLRNDYRTKLNKEGNVRFKSTKAELESLSTKQLQALQKSLQDYKESKTGTLRKVIEFKEKMTKMFKERFEKQTGQKFTEKAKRTMSDIYNHKNYSRWIEAFTSDSILRLVGEIGIEPTYELLNEFNNDVPIAYMDKRINDELKKLENVIKIEIHLTLLFQTTISGVDYMERFIYDKKKKKYVLDRVIVADTETSHIGEDACWIYETGIYDGEQFYIGRKPTDFLKHLREIKNKFGLDERSYAIIYFHNLSYDISYLLPWILSVYNDTEVFALDKRKILTVRFGCFELRCSYLLSNMSLDLWGYKLGITNKKKKGLIDYNVVRYPDTELDSNDKEYFKYDLLSLYDCVTKQLELYNDTLATIPLTSTGYERRKCRKACNNPKYRTFFERTRLSPNTYRMCRNAFAGGYVHANRFLINKTLVSLPNRKIRHRDMKSFYPSVQMLCYFPVSQFILTIDKPTLLQDCFQYFTKKCCLATITIENPKLKDGVTAPYLQYSKCFGGHKIKKDNGRVLSAKGDITLTVTELDLELITAQYNYDSIYVLEMYTARKGEFPIELKNVVNDAFQYKETLKKDSELYGKSKNLLNGIYGMTATDIVRDLFELQNDRTIEKKRGNVLNSLNKYYKGRNNFMPYQFGVWTTAHCRNILIKLIERIGYENFIYCDTDSIFYFESEESVKVVEEYNDKIISMNKEKGYGVLNRDNEYSYYMTFEDENDNIQKFRTLHSKCYVLINGDGEMVCTIAGVTKDNKLPKDNPKYKTISEELGDIDNLESDFTFVECGGTKSKYMSVDAQEVNINEHLVEIGDGCIITPTTKTLSSIKSCDIMEIYERA